MQQRSAVSAHGSRVCSQGYSSPYVLPRPILIGIFVAMSVVTLWLLLNESLSGGLVSALVAAAALTCDSMGTWSRVQRRLAARDAFREPVRFVAWQARDPGMAEEKTPAAPRRRPARHYVEAQKSWRKNAA